MQRRTFILSGSLAVLAPAFVTAQSYPAITRPQLNAALAEVAEAHPKRFAELGEATSKIERRGNAVYVYYAGGRVRLLQERSGELRLPSKAVELDSDPKPEKRESNSATPAPDGGGQGGGGGF